MGSPYIGPAMQSFDMLFGISLNKLLTKQYSCQWFVMPRGLCNVTVMTDSYHSSNNDLLPLGKFEWNFRYFIFLIISVIDGWGISCDLALRWMSLDLTDDKSTLVQVMASCHQATSNYLSQCWPRSLAPYGITRPQWVNITEPGERISYCIKNCDKNLAALLSATV